eukprot:comp17990_c0_seq2/m.31348 comp17990_c0_seq2/g.31348  ORF comp17990_c0_seq2/g.31348 comp17990_c0_seq2/m.31348 type:complete len:596 (+) comp17990_c0_seq2:81-1868(+)
MEAGSTSLAQVKAASSARKFEEASLARRKKDTLVLVLRHLADNGYIDACDRLQSESGVSLEAWDAADNMDLLTIIQEFEAFYEIKFGKRPKLARKIGEGPKKNLGVEARERQGALPAILRQKGDSAGTSSSSAGAAGGAAGGAAASAGSTAGRAQNMGRSRSNDNIDFNPNEQVPTALAGAGSHSAREPMVRNTKASSAGASSQNSQNQNQNQNKDEAGIGGLGLMVQPIKSAPPGQAGKPPRGGSGAAPSKQASSDSAGGGGGAAGSENGEDVNGFFERRVLKPLTGFWNGDMEMRQLAQIITRDIYLENPNVRWGDIAGLDMCKRLLKEAVVMPIKYPQLFTGILTPWKGVLLFGPPGTGKTMLAKAVATECGTTFFNISASTIVSKWRGDSEKLVRVLFELARYHAPSTIFIDEMDSIMSQRETDGSEHEGSRRLKTELLIQMDGLNRTSDLVFVMAATNLPWSLDHALLRRLEKRIFVSLPNDEARKRMFEKLLPPSYSAALEYNDLAAKTDGYSGSDISILCKEAAMIPLRRLMDKLETLDSDKLKDDMLKLDPVSNEDVARALASTKPTAKGQTQKYIDWERSFGASID